MWTRSSRSNLSTTWHAAWLLSWLASTGCAFDDAPATSTAHQAIVVGATAPSTQPSLGNSGLLWKEHVGGDIHEMPALECETYPATPEDCIDICGPDADAPGWADCADACVADLLAC